MKNASVRDLRNHFARVSKWIEAGEEVRILKRGKPLARIIPDSVQEKIERPDFMGRLKEIYGEKVTPDSAELFEYARGDR